ncbi:hypothetical protein [Schumannella sp. 10F1B-5-1]|uniref:hypothetical protein n=1 Tax=Schumannella sp. 10F1B-5-1 TaxID=2590780 RepID=UPI0011324E76|nr:hypothetical protein [Schumannella sp. 10F1B-5-1]TPW70991.1 hypothetical protein FJ658_12915 [Schumannella sp. 10F1B-5-1]
MTTPPRSDPAPPPFDLGYRRANELPADHGRRAVFSEAPRADVPPVAAGANPSAAPTGLSRRGRRVRAIAISAAVLLVLIIASSITIGAVNRAMFAPTGTAEQYLRLVARGDVAQAVKLAPPTADGGSALLVDAALADPESRLQDWKLGDVRRTTSDGVDRAVIEVEYQLGGAEVQTEIELESRGRQWGVFDDWRVVRGLDRELSVRIDTVDTATVNGVDVDVDGGQAVFAVLPGRYDAEYRDSRWLYAASASTAVGADDDKAAISLSLGASHDLAALVQPVADGEVDACLAQTASMPAGCPFGTSIRGVDAVTWSVESYPRLDFRLVDEHELSWSGEGVVVATYTRDDGAGPETSTRRVRSVVSGSVALDGAEPTVTAD